MFQTNKNGVLKKSDLVFHFLFSLHYLQNWDSSLYRNTSDFDHVVRTFGKKSLVDNDARDQPEISAEDTV